MTVALASQAQLIGAVERANSITLSAYVLSAHAQLVAALERAAERGARVAVELQGTPYGEGSSGPLALENGRTASELRSHGVSVRVTEPHDVPLHMKAAVVDGTAYLDDRNWPSRGSDTLIATTDAADVAAVASPLAGHPQSAGDLATDKSRALELEARVISAAGGDRIDIESESFGPSVVSSALRERALGGTHVRLLVAEREFAGPSTAERTSLARLAAAGVEVRVAREAEKLCVAGDCAWIGSANATFATASEPTIDWGMRIPASGVLDHLAAEFARNWDSAVPAFDHRGAG